MNDIIRLLPDSVANQIAAGEVIQYPASAIKELVENAADAGATEIRIVIKDAGKTLIQVADNGQGMSETDARMAFERHATSKIRSADDLFRLSTMGFRGEALPSICAISEVDVKTRREGDAIGTHLIISGSKVECQEPCVCDKGTVITVRKLFYNMPARRKFLKSDNVELARIMREFERMALVNNSIRLTIDTGVKTIDLRKASLHNRIIDLWKSNLDSQLVPVDVDTALVKIEGFITRPEYARRRNPLQFLIANGRNMRHHVFHKAIISCFEGLIAVDTQPCYFLKFTVDPAAVDVNRSPTKDDVKFEYEQQIRPILVASIKAALGKFSAVPSIDFSSDAIPVLPLGEGELPKAPKLNIEAGYNPFKATRANHSNSDWEKLYDGFSGSSVRNTVSPDEFLSAPSKEESEYGETDLFSDSHIETVAPICLQYAGKYIITPSRDGLLLVDQHRAHVKVLYEDYIKRVRSMEVVSQRIMFPESVQLDETQREALLEIESDLKRMGFELEYESDNIWNIVAIPAMVHNIDSKDIVLRIIDSVSEDSENYGRDDRSDNTIIEKAALLMSRSSAIRRGVKLSVAEMEHLIGELFGLPDPAFTPNGNPVFCILDENKIERMFNS